VVTASSPSPSPSLSSPSPSSLFMFVRDDDLVFNQACFNLKTGRAWVLIRGALFYTNNMKIFNRKEWFA
jgi:hypothetical protein